MAETTPQTSPVSASGPMPAPDTSMTAGGAPQQAPDVPNNPLAQPAAPSNPNAINPAVAPAAPVVPPKHAHLLAMVQGLADGLSAAGKSLSTGGKEGGAQEVQQLQAQRQAAKQSAQAAQQAQTEADLRNKLTTASTNQMNATTHLLIAQTPDEIAQSHLKTTGEQQTQAITGADFQQTHGGMRPEEYSTAMSSTAPITGEGSSANPFFVGNAKSVLRQATASGLPATNPAVQRMQDVLANPQSTAKDVAMATQQLDLERQRQGAAGEQLAKQQAVAPLGDKVAALNQTAQDRYQVLNPGKPLPDEFKLPPNATQKDFDRVDGALSKIEGAQATKANRDIVNGMREQMLDLAKGSKIPGDETKSGAEYMATLPAGLQGTVKSIGEGRAAPPPAGSRSPAAQSILGALNRAYPEYDTTNYPSYLDARKKFTSGPEGKGINAINTVETHLSRMYDHATAPGTSGGITGKVTGFFGDKDVRALDIDRTAVSTELSKAYAAGQISEGEVRDWEDKLDFTKPGMTTGKLITNLKEIDGLLEGKQKAYETQWNTASPSASIVSPVPIISSDAIAARAKIRGESAPAAGGHVIDIGGVQYTYNGSGDTADLKNYTKK